MNKTAIGTAGVIVVLLLLGWLFFWRGNVEAPSVSEETPGEQTEQEQMLITAKHQYIDGKHIVAGEVNVPTPCHILQTDANVSTGATPDQAIIDFTATTQADTCAQVLTPARFKVEFDADENADIKATWNGMPARLNLIPVDSDESLVDFEIYIKG